MMSARGGASPSHALQALSGCYVVVVLMMGVHCSVNSRWRWRWRWYAREEEESRWRLRNRNACEMRLFGAVGMRQARNRRLLRTGSLWRFFPARSKMWSFEELQQLIGFRGGLGRVHCISDFGLLYSSCTRTLIAFLEAAGSGFSGGELFRVSCINALGWLLKMVEIMMKMKKTKSLFRRRMGPTWYLSSKFVQLLCTTLCRLLRLSEKLAML